MPDEQSETTEASTTETEETLSTAGEGAEKEKSTEFEKAKETEKTEQPQVDLVDDKFEFSVPDGMDLDKDSLKGFKEFSVNEKLPKKTAQSVLDHLIESQKKAEEIRKANVNKTVEKNKEIIKSDPEIGGENYDKVQSAVDRITLRYGGQDFKAQVNDAGLKNEPTFLRFIRNLSEVLSEDKIISPTQNLGQPAQKTYQEIADDFITKD